MKTVTSAYAKANLVEQGERVTISRYNKPVADLVPTSGQTRPLPKLGTGKGKVKILDPRWAEPLTDQEIESLLTNAS